MRFLLILIFMAVPLSCIAQKSVDNHKKAQPPLYLSLQGAYRGGYVFGTNNFLRGHNSAADRINAFQSFSVKFANQTTGKNRWEQFYNNPEWGIGMYAANFDNRSELGIPVALYGFFNAPFKRWNKLSFNYELGFGAAFNWNAFNPITNPYNTAIGGKTSFFIDAGLSLKYHFANRIDLISGFALTHFSNGALKEPNKGINTIAPSLSVKYNFYDPPVFIQKPLRVYHDENEWVISFFGGLKNVVFDSADVSVREKYAGVNFPVFGVSSAFNQQVSRKSKIGIGMTVSYNGSVNAQAAVDNNELEAVDRPLSDKLQLSIYPSYELLINRVSVILQPAFYVYRKNSKKKASFFYQRVGLKYHFTDHYFVGIILRDFDFHHSDFIEWNLGYRLKWK